MNKKIFDVFLNKSGKDKITIIVLIGILLMVIALPTKKSGSGSKVTTDEKNHDMTASLSYSEYGEYLEKKLESTLKKVDGVGEVCVSVSLKTTSQKVLATDDENVSEQIEEDDGDGGKRISVTNNKKSSNIFYDTLNGSEPYVTLENMPEIEGVIIVAKGGGNGEIAAGITSAVEALLGIPVHKIKVLKMS